MTGETGTDWAGYYAWSAGREPRPMLLAACQRLGDGARRVAVDLGCGAGTKHWHTYDILARRPPGHVHPGD